MTTSLRRLVLGFTSLAVVTVALVALTLDIRQRIDIAEDRLAAQTRRLASGAVPLLVSALVVGDLATAEQTLRSLNVDLVWARVRLYEPDGERLILDVSPPPTSVSAVSRWSRRWLPLDLPETRLLIAADPVAYGVLAVTPSSHALQAELWDEIRYTAIVAACLIVTLLVLIGMILARGLRPLRVLAERATQLGEGDLSARMPETRLAEVAPTVRAFNTMAANLQGLLAEREAVNRDLERRVAERTARLAEANESLRREIEERARIEVELRQAQKLEAIGQLAAGVAHEINTPIQFVGDNARFLRTCFDDLERVLDAYRELAAAVEPGMVPAGLLEEVRTAERAADVAFLAQEIRPALAQTLEGVTRVAAIVGALKTFAHPDQHHKVAADLNEALANTMVMARNEIKDVADVEMDLGELPMVVCYPGELNQVFLNLVVNAAHAIEDAVKGTGRRGVIQVRSVREGDLALVTVSDSGTGIPESAREHVFEPFFTTKDVGRGTGQGLAIAHNVVVGKHGGTVTFETEIGRGTTFSVRLPIEGEGALSAAATETQAGDQSLAVAVSTG